MRMLLLVTLCSCAHLKHGVVFWGRECPEGTRYRVEDDGRRMGKREWCEVPRSNLAGIRHGFYVRTWPDGTPRELGEYDHGKQAGTWQRFREDGSLLETTEYRENEESGEQVRWHQSGQRMWRGWIKDGKRQGHWTGFFADGEPAWEGPFKEGRPFGAWVFFGENGKAVLEQDFGELEPPEFWKRRQPCPDAATLHGRPPPEGRHVDCREQPKESLTAVLHGPTADLNADGSLRVTGYWLHGAKHGHWITWRENGSPRVLETWRHGGLDGPQLQWDREGVLRTIIHYSDGVAGKTWIRPWCPDGGYDEHGSWWECSS